MGHPRSTRKKIADIVAAITILGLDFAPCDIVDGRVVPVSRETDPGEEAARITREREMLQDPATLMRTATELAERAVDDDRVINSGRMNRLLSGPWRYASEKINAMYGRLEFRYGPRYAKVIVACAVVGMFLPVPIPGTTYMAAAPTLAIAELHLRLARRLGMRPQNGAALGTNDPQSLSTDGIVTIATRLRVAIIALFRDTFPPG